jgi:endoglycosylceramidase
MFVNGWWYFRGAQNANLRTTCTTTHFVSRAAGTTDHPGGRTEPRAPSEIAGHRPHRINGPHRCTSRPLARPLAGALVLVSALTVTQLAGEDAPTGASSSAVGGPLGHSGRWITDARGRVVILHGLNMVNKRAPYTPAAAGFGATAAKTLADNGFDVVRLGVLYQSVEPRPGVFNRRYLRSIAKTVAQLARHGVYSLLDFHQDEMNQEFGGEGFPTWSVETDGLPVQHYVFSQGYLESPALDRAYDNFWTDQQGRGGVGLQQRYVAAWEQVARQFAGDPWVLGYDLFNEPWPADGTAAELASFYTKTIAGIRSVDRRHLIWYEPYVTFDYGIQTQLPSFSDRLLGMSFHDYCLGNAEQEPTTCAASEKTTVANALAHSASTGVALMMTEFGATDDYGDLGRVMDIADAHQLPWIEWAYCGCDDPTGTIPPRTEALVYNPARPGTGTNVNLVKLQLLAEPYPRVVSGTPLSYTFDQTTRTFRLVYTTKAPDGHRFGAGACTAVIVPPVQYPTGYRVKVDGGRVLSRTGAGVLQVGSTGGHDTVSVTVTPDGHGRTTDAGPVPASCT